MDGLLGNLPLSSVRSPFLFDYGAAPVPSVRIRPVLTFLSSPFAVMDADYSAWLNATNRQARNDSVMEVISVKTLKETMMVVGSLLFWSAFLPLIFVMEVGVLMVDKIDGRADTGSASAIAH
jgi:hypothetical protein